MNGLYILNQLHYSKNGKNLQNFYNLSFYMLLLTKWRLIKALNCFCNGRNNLTYLTHFTKLLDQIVYGFSLNDQKCVKKQYISQQKLF